MLGCTVEATCSPRVECKVAAVSTAVSSYENGSVLLKELAGLNISAKQCERIAQRVGRERLAERSEELERYERLTLPEQRQAPPEAPRNSWEGRVAAVLLDGGRAQVRDERWGQPHPPGERVSWWKEPKVACLATFSSQAHDRDPLPEVPECLLDPLWFVPRVTEIKRGRSGELESAPPAALAPAGPQDEPPRWSPEPLVRSVVATFQPYEELGRLAEVEAHRRGFPEAQRKAVLGDGHRSNWNIHQQRFSHYTGITDLMHALSYIYQAAQASTPDMPACWERCARWIRSIWQGQVRDVIRELAELPPAADERDGETLQTSLTYLTNNAGRMQYPKYRQQGLPITTALIESTIKQINRRMKGTEKFWSPGAEPQLQLCADRLSETEPLTAFWRRRADCQTGFRKPRANP